MINWKKFLSWFVIDTPKPRIFMQRENEKEVWYCTGVEGGRPFVSTGNTPNEALVSYIEKLRKSGVY